MIGRVDDRRRGRGDWLDVREAVFARNGTAEVALQTGKRPYDEDDISNQPD